MTTLTPIGGPPGPALSRRVESPANGAFAAVNLAAGTYTVCATVKGGGGYLDPCAWEPEPRVQLAANQAISGFRVLVKKASTVQVRLNDAGRILETPAARGRTAPHVVLAIVTPKHIFLPLPLVGKDGNGRNHRGAIALDQDSSLYIAGKGIRLIDGTGIPVSANGSTLRIRPGPGNSPAVLNFTVDRP